MCGPGIFTIDSILSRFRQRMKLRQPKDSPNLIKLKYLGDDILIDHNEGSITAIGRTPKCCFDKVIKYLVDEGFFTVEEEEKGSEGGNN